MRILLIGPQETGGSIPPYLDVLARALRELGVHVDRLGSTGVPYDRGAHAFWSVDRIMAEAHRLLRSADLCHYDLLAVHFGNLEVEQLLPVLWQGVPRPPAVYHVHSLAWTLFTDHQPRPDLFSAVQNGVRSMDGYIHFGMYARDAAADVVNPTAPNRVAWLPTTIPEGTASRLTPRLRTVLMGVDKPVASLYGYAATWKDAPTLRDALSQTTKPVRAVLAGPFWDDPAQAFTDLTAEARAPVPYGASELAVVADYMTPAHRRALVNASDLAIFPYRACPTFQGSGAIGDYLAYGVPVVAADVANMAELVSDAGTIVPPGDPDAFSMALDQLAGDTSPHRAAREAARQRAHRFTAPHHAARCLRLYETVLARTPSRTR